MADARIPDEQLGLGLRSVGRELAYPPTPGLGAAVTWRLEASGSAGRRPPFPRIALWSRRRALVFAAVGLLAILGLAFGARFVLGAAEVRVQPGLTPSGPPVGPGELGEPRSLEEVSTAVGFELELPAGPGPDEAYVVSRTGLEDVALLAWAPSERYPPLPDTSWGLVLIELTGDEDFLVKDVNRFEDLRTVRVDDRRAFWIDAPHELTLITANGPETFAVRGNVLIWTRSGITFRLETSMPLRQAIALAETIA